jgi:hypothetical protein
MDSYEGFHTHSFNKKAINRVLMFSVTNLYELFESSPQRSLYNLYDPGLVSANELSKKLITPITLYN